MTLRLGSEAIVGDKLLGGLSIPNRLAVPARSAKTKKRLRRKLANGTLSVEEIKSRCNGTTNIKRLVEQLQIQSPEKTLESSNRFSKVIDAARREH